MTNTHQKQWEFLKDKFKSGQISHSYLLSGDKQIGKKLFAKEFIKFINCVTAQTEKSEKPCQKCINCQLIEKETFPELMFLRAGERDEKFGDGDEIKIAKIRGVQDFLNLKSYYGGYKAVIVEDAEKMNQEAQSCFLKTLEEPKGQTILFLISSKPEILLDTIRSRCQQIKFFGKQIESKEDIEKESKVLGELLKVAECDLSEKFKYSKSLDFDEIKLSNILIPFEKYLRYLLLKKIGAGEKSYFSEMSSVFENYSVEKLKQIINLTEEINNKLFFTAVNQKLALEILLMEF